MSLYEANEESSAPATPSADRKILYPKSGAWYKKDAAGNERRFIEADGTGKIALADLPVAVAGSMNYQGREQ